MQLPLFGEVQSQVTHVLRVSWSRDISVTRGHTKIYGTAHTPQSCSERVMFMGMMNELIAHHVAVMKSRRRSAARGTKPRLLRARRSRVGNNAAIRQPSRQPKRTVGPFV